MYNFVAKKSIVDSFKGSKYFKVNLGHSLSVGKSGQRKFQINDKDKFTKFYHTKYRIALLSEGNIGSLNFFSDYYIEEEIVVVFFGDKDFVFVHEPHTMRAKGIDAYLGSIIKEIELNHEEEIVVAGNYENANTPSINDNNGVGDANKLISNPGSASWEDVKAYMQKKKNL